MDYHDIVRVLKMRRDKIQEAINALENQSMPRRKYQRRKKRKLSATARRRKSEAMKRRWEQRKRHT